MISNVRHPYIEWQFEGKDVNSTILCSQVENDSVDTWKGLVEYGIDIYRSDSFGFTPLHYALFHGKDDLCEYLISISKIQRYCFVDTGQFKLSIVDYAVFRKTCSNWIITLLEKKRLAEKACPSPWFQAIERSWADPFAFETLIECAPYQKNEIVQIVKAAAELENLYCLNLLLKIALKVKDCKCLKHIFKSKPIEMGADYQLSRHALALACKKGSLGVSKSILKARGISCFSELWRKKKDETSKEYAQRLKSFAKKIPLKVDSLAHDILIDEGKIYPFHCALKGNNKKLIDYLLFNFYPKLIEAMAYTPVSKQQTAYIVKRAAKLDNIDCLKLLIKNALKVKDFKSLKLIFKAKPYELGEDYQMSRHALELACANGSLGASKSILKARWRFWLSAILERQKNETYKKYFRRLKSIEKEAPLKNFYQSQDILIHDGKIYPFHCALQAGNQQLIDFLLRNFYSSKLIETKDALGRTPLLIAAAKSLKSTQKIIAAISRNCKKRNQGWELLSPGKLVESIKVAKEHKNKLAMIFLNRVTQFYFCKDITELKDINEFIATELRIHELLEKIRLLKSKFFYINPEEVVLIIKNLILLEDPNLVLFAKFLVWFEKLANLYAASCA